MWRFLIAASVLALGAFEAQAQDYPNRTINLVVPYPAGGAVDTLGRLTAAKLSEKLGVSVVPLNQAGAAGSIGSNAVRVAKPDGYTLLFNASIFALARYMLKDPPYDPETDFAPVARVGEIPLLVVANPKVPADTLTALLPLLRAKPESFNFAISSPGSAGHLATLELMRIAGVKIQTIAYRGSAPALNDAAAGEVQLMIDPMTSALPQVRGNRLKALAVTTRERSTLAPDLPTSAESGMPELIGSSWYGVWGPKALPADIVDKLAKALALVVADPDFVSRATNAGIGPVFEGPDAFKKFIADDIARNAALLKAADFKPE